MLNTKILLLSLVLVLVITLSVFFILKDNIKFELFENNVIPNELINEREQLKDTNYITMADISSGINTNKVHTQNLNVKDNITTGSMKVNRPDNEKWPNGWGKGIHSWDVYVNGTVGAGKDGNVAAYINRDGWIGGDNLVLGNNGNNKWILHAPNDNRKTLFIAPQINGRWAWEKQININNNGDLNVGSKINTKGGTSVHNPNGWGTHFPWSDGKNYIRGDTEIRGNVNNIGDLTVGGRFRTSENHRCFFHETTASDGSVANNTNVFLDRLGWNNNWTCPSNTYLNGLRFQNKGWGTMNMLYKCCKIDKD